MPILALPRAAQALLAVTEMVADEEGITLPERRYVAASAGGEEAWDCEQVTVALLQLNPSNAAGGNSGEWVTGTPSDTGAIPPPEAYLRIEIVRGVPVLASRRGEFTPVMEEQKRGLIAMQDAALLHAVRCRIANQAAITEGLASDIRLGAVIPSGAAGGYAGMALIVGATLIGTSPVLAPA